MFIQLIRIAKALEDIVKILKEINTELWKQGSRR